MSETTVGFTENEISAKSYGGTELTKRSIAIGIEPKLAENFQIICSRVRDISADKIRVYWLHDLPEDPEANHLKNESSRSRFHKFIYSSNWQYQQYIDKLSIEPNLDSVVIETPVDPIPYMEKNKEEIRLIYFSTPHRGLELLVPVFEKLCEKHNNIVLDVFSSFSIYGWAESDKHFENLFERCRNHPKINYHGFQPNEVVRKALQKAHIFAYPSIWKETSCRCLIESMSAGLLCVHPNYAALSDTSGGLTAMYDMDSKKPAHANEFYKHLDNAIMNVHSDACQNYLKFVKSYADGRFNLSKITDQWTQLLENLLIRYPTLESRTTKKEFFRYKA